MCALSKLTVMSPCRGAPYSRKPRKLCESKIHSPDLARKTAHSSTGGLPSPDPAVMHARPDRRSPRTAAPSSRWARDLEEASRLGRWARSCLPFPSSPSRLFISSSPRPAPGPPSSGEVADGCMPHILAVAPLGRGVLVAARRPAWASSLPKGGEKGEKGNAPKATASHHAPMHVYSERRHTRSAGRAVDGCGPSSAGWHAVGFAFLPPPPPELAEMCPVISSSERPRTPPPSRSQVMTWPMPHIVAAASLSRGVRSLARRAH
jgi:hypothetical protein